MSTTYMLRAITMTRDLLRMLCLVLAVMPCLPVIAQSDQAIDRYWNREWRDFTGYFLEHEGRYYCFPDYDPERRSNKGPTPEQFMAERAYQNTFRSRSRADNPLTLPVPLADAEAATLVLREPEAGDYGYIHTGVVKEVESRTGVVVHHVWLVDWPKVTEDRRVANGQVGPLLAELLPGPERDPAGVYVDELREKLREGITFQFENRVGTLQYQGTEGFAKRSWRLLGFDTVDAKPGERWPVGPQAEQGLHLAIIDVSEGVVTAVPADRLGKELSELELLTALEQFGVSKAQFVELVREAKREAREGYIVQVLEALLAMRAEAEQAEPAE